MQPRKDLSKAYRKKVSRKEKDQEEYLEAEPESDDKGVPVRKDVWVKINSLSIDKVDQGQRKILEVFVQDNMALVLLTKGFI